MSAGEQLPYWVSTETGYAAARALAEQMGTANAHRLADLLRPGEPLLPPYDREVPACWVDDGWVRLVEPAAAAPDEPEAEGPDDAGQLTFEF